MDPLKRSLYTTLTLLFLVGFTLGPPAAQAQNEDGQVFFGVEGGLASTNLSGENADGSSLSGFTGGAHLMYNVNEAFSVQFGVRYTRRGADSFTATSSARVSEAWNLENAEYRFEYIDVPVLLKLTAPVEAVKIRGFVGPSLNFRFNSTVNGEDIIRALQSNREVNTRNLHYDVGAVVGGEFALPLPVSVPGLRSPEIFLDGRYEYGLIDVADVAGFEYKHRGFNGTIGLRFGVN